MAKQEKKSKLEKEIIALGDKKLLIQAFENDQLPIDHFELMFAIYCTGQVRYMNHKEILPPLLTHPQFTNDHLDTLIGVITRSSITSHHWSMSEWWEATTLIVRHHPLRSNDVYVVREKIVRGWVTKQTAARAASAYAGYGQTYTEEWIKGYAKCDHLGATRYIRPSERVKRGLEYIQKIQDNKAVALTSGNDKARALATAILKIMKRSTIPAIDQE